MCTGENVGAMAKGRAAHHKNAVFNALDGTVGEVCGLSKEEFSTRLKDCYLTHLRNTWWVIHLGRLMLKLHFAVAEDEQTLLTVMTRGLATEVEVPPGKDLEFAKNRAIDKLWQNIPFCHAVAALSTLRLFEDGVEVLESTPCRDQQRLLLAAEAPDLAKPVAAEAAAFAGAVDALGRHKLGLNETEATMKPESRDELMKQPMKELKARLSKAGLSAEGCLEKADLVERLLGQLTAWNALLSLILLRLRVAAQQKKVGDFTALFAVGGFLPALGDSEAGAVLAEFVSGTRQVPIETYFIDSRSAAFLQAAPDGKKLCEKIQFLGGLGVRELHGLKGPGQAATFSSRRGRIAMAVAVMSRLRFRRRLWRLRATTDLGSSLSGDGPRSTVLVNVGCYYTLADTLEKVEGPRYVAQGYAYVLWRASGPLEEVADQVFQRWRADAGVVLDWVGEQPWCNGRIGCHGYSLLGNTSYATLAASHAPDAPATRPVVRCVVPAISFSRIQPTVFVRGQSLAAELALRFLWLAEVGLRQGRLVGFSYIWNMFGFFGLPDWPGLEPALAQRPVTKADVDLWGRANVLWQGGQTSRSAANSFWTEGRDKQFHFDGFRKGVAPHVHVIAGWNDMFLLQSLDDFVEASRLTDARLTIYTGGHFGVVMNHAGEVAAETGRCYREHLAGDVPDRRKAVRMQLITGKEKGEPPWLECDHWPPPDPTPYAGDGWLNLQKDGPQEQRGLETSRTKDLLLLTSDPLESMEIVGEVRVSLHVRCSAPECDLVARLCVVHASGANGWPMWPLTDPRQLGPGRSVNLCENIARTQFHKDEVQHVEFSLGYTACRLEEGDQLRLHVCSAAHPRWLRHPLQPQGEDWLLGNSEVGSPAQLTIESPSCYDAATYAKPAEDDGPCFVGSAYTTTAVQKLIKLAKAEGSPIDILLTAEWPRGMEERMDESEKPKDPDGMASVGRLSRALRARRGYATLLLAEHNNKSLNKATLHAVTAASKLPGCTSVDLLVAGKGCGEVAKAGASTQGVSKVLVAESDQLEHPVADVVAELLEAVQKQNSYKVIAGISSSLVKECLPRVAANLDVQPVTDILEVGQEDGVFSRPMYAGNAIATVKTTDSVRLLTFRQTAFEAAPESASAAPIESLSAATYSGAGIEWLKDSEATSDKPQLSSASRVVAGGRGLKNGENFEKVLEPLCDKLKAALGASRAAVDAGFVPNELQVGQTGKVVAPQLYIAVGISGAIQHLAGMKDSKTIVAINKDADAPIFQVADYGLVADLFETVPELTDKV
eukprot:symbB.v1.2.009524.t4/scaffold606.1/size182035/14